MTNYKLTDLQLMCKIMEARKIVPPHSMWYNLKNQNLYRINKIVLRENDLKEMVEYQTDTECIPFVRPVDEFIVKFGRKLD